MQNRFKSKVVWVSVVALILLVSANFGLYEKVGITQEAAKNMFDMVLTILVGFGVLNNPNNPDSF